MILRLLADANLKGAIVSGVSRRVEELDFKRAEDVPLEGLDDPVVLDIAAQERRVLVSHDFSTMHGHFREYVSGRASPGVILIPQTLSIGRAVDDLALICEASDESDLKDRICYIPSLVIFGF